MSGAMGGFGTVDAALWSAAVALLALALWLTSREGDRWDPATWFAAALGARWGGSPPLAEGPIEPEGWDGDVRALEAAYTPAARLGPGLDWPDLEGWTPAVEAALARRLADVRLVWLGEPALAVPAVATATMPSVEAAEPVLEPLLERPEVRLVLAARGAAAQPLLALLRDAPRLRDRLRAVLLVAPEIDAAWLAEKFTHEAFDTELMRQVPYLALRVPGVAPLPDPPEPPSARRAVLPVDLGVVPPEVVGDARVGQATAAVLAALG